MVHSTKLQTIGGKETPGDVLTDELRADIWKNLCSALDQAGVGPIVMWGEWAMLYYGVPINENHLHILVPDDQLEVAYDAMKASGYKDWPFELQEDYGLLDPNIRWAELGAPARRMFGDLHNERAHLPVVLQNYASAASTFDKETAATFESKKVGIDVTD
ncbi:hypothetical protein FA13DRAFT_993954 [Coprinellus micaceus]|uniref:Uncharacterized protein n=1 Tax=Coprinellus micaceus TaxID=71717 RepID=A0A4Y7SYU9_COPMI|nr:hypothetical protein FA13DRAFT_993954 [Coprinellus micaceus]